METVESNKEFNIRQLNENIDDLNKKLKFEINNKNKLQEKIEFLNKKLNEEKEKNQELINLNEILKSNLNNEKLKNIDLQNKIDKQINIIHNNDSKINDLYARIDDLKEKLSRYPFELKKDEKMISVIFTSDDQKIHFSVICKNTEKFNRLEEKLYNDYPEYSETNNYFVVNGNRIQKFKTLDENNIRNSDIIILNQINI